MSDPLSLRSRLSQALRCSVCHDRRGLLTACQRCWTRFHDDCRNDLGRCPTLGCRAIGPRPAAPPVRPREGAPVAHVVGYSVVSGFVAAAFVAAPIAARSFDTALLAAVVALIFQLVVTPALLVRLVLPGAGWLAGSLGGFALSLLVAFVATALTVTLGALGLEVLAVLLVVAHWFFAPGVVAWLVHRAHGTAE
ncbi:MAG: hypothetical protein ACAI25_06305 [Planctomycetota bacterium]